MSRDHFPAQVALPDETIPQRIEALAWFFRRRPTAPLTFLAVTAVLMPFIALYYAPAPVRTSWPAAALLALAGVLSVWLVVAVVICVGYFWLAALPSVTRWATEDARIGIWVRERGNKPGWHAAEHVARPGVAGAGREIRLLLYGVLRERGDRDGVWLYASTRSEKLAERYCEDIPGLRVVRRTRWGRIDLERPPRGEWPSPDAD